LDDDNACGSVMKAAAGVTVALASAIVKRSRGAACRDRLSIPSVKFSILILILV
jgi:hypothetical protein